MSPSERAPYDKVALDGDDASSAGNPTPLGGKTRDVKRIKMIENVKLEQDDDSTRPGLELALLSGSSALCCVANAKSEQRKISTQRIAAMELRRENMEKLDASVSGVPALAAEAMPMLVDDSSIGSLPSMPQWSGTGTCNFQHLAARSDKVVEAARSIVQLDAKDRVAFSLGNSMNGHVPNQK